MKGVEQELNEALFGVGITDLFSAEKFDSKIYQHFENIGKLNEFKQHLESSDAEARAYQVLGREGITIDPDNFLRLNSERVAYVGEHVVPLKGKREQLKRALQRIVEVKKELSYPGEVYDLPSFVDPENGFFDTETKRWVYPEDFIQANKSAYDFGGFWWNIDESIKESEDPFVQALIHSNELPEYDPGEELRQMRLASEFNKNQVKLELLEELGRTKIYKEKKWGVVPKTKMVMNPGYEEFFHNHLGDYSVQEVDGALKDLEKELTCGNKTKIRALRKEFEKKEGISRRKKLGYIILGGLAAGTVLGVAYELTRDRKPPVVKDLKWEPTRTVNDKVYDGTVSFAVEDEGPIIPLSNKAGVKEVSLQFVPVNYTHLPKEAFPNESVRSYRLTPLDGAFDENREEFAVNITNIIGGREYDIRVTAQDRAGNVGDKNLITSYIREFERFIPDYLIGASYMTFWDVYWEYAPAGRWKEVDTVYEPILGQYNSGDRTVINKHIDWATGHGIRFFCLDFGWIKADSPFDRIARECLFKSDLVDSINFTISYTPDASKGSDALYSDFSFLATYYFAHPSYLKVSDKTVVKIANFQDYWGKLGVNETNNLFKDLKGYIKDKYGYELFLVADVWPNTDPSFLNDPNLSFDGIINMGNVWDSVGGNKVEYNQYANKYAGYWEKCSSLAEQRGLQFIPFVFSGFDDKPYADYFNWTHHCITRDLEEYRQLLRVAKKVASSLKMINLFSWNDFHEGTIMEKDL